MTTSTWPKGSLLPEGWTEESRGDLEFRLETLREDRKYWSNQRDTAQHRLNGMTREHEEYRETKKQFEDGRRSVDACTLAINAITIFLRTGKTGE